MCRLCARDADGGVAARSVCDMWCVCGAPRAADPRLYVVHVVRSKASCSSLFRSNSNVKGTKALAGSGAPQPHVQGRDYGQAVRHGPAGPRPSPVYTTRAPPNAHTSYSYTPGHVSGATHAHRPAQHTHTRSSLDTSTHARHSPVTDTATHHDPGDPQHRCRYTSTATLLARTARHAGLRERVAIVPIV